MPAKTPWGSVAALLVAGVIVALQIGKAIIAVPVLQKDMGLSLTFASSIIGAYGVIGAFGGLPAGIAISLFSARKALLAGLIACGAGSLAGAAAANGTMLIATRVVEGCGFLVAVIAIPRLLRSIAAPRDSEIVLALWGAYMPAGSLVMMLAGPHLMAFGWQTMWVVNGAVVLGYALFLLAFDFREPAAASTAHETGGNIRAVLGAPGPILLAGMFGLYTFQYAAMTGLLPVLLVDRLHLSIAGAGAVVAITVAANALGNVSASALLRFGVPFWAIAACAFAFATCAGFGVFTDTLPLVAVAALASISLALTGMIPASIYAASPKFAPAPAVLAIALGLITQASNIGNLVGPPAMAAVVDTFGWGRAPFLFAAVTGTGVAISLLLWRLTKR
ncbi:MAG TPA: MFS transporter [Pseudolabrys sp.]|nr:MFS transporter [Pseudolabrys sp.]